MPSYGESSSSDARPRPPSPATALGRAAFALACLWLFLLAVALFLDGPGSPLLRADRVAKLGGLLAAELAWAALFHPFLRLGKRARMAVGLPWLTALLLVPLLLPAEERILRVPVAIVAALLCFKLYDVHLRTARRGPPDPWTFLSFLAIPFPLLLREHERAHGGGGRSGEGRKAFPWDALAAMLAGSAAFLGSYRVDWSEWPFLAEHGVKALSFFVVFTSSVALVTWAVRRAGGRFPEFADRPFLSRTPAEFWRRYNIPIGRFLYEDVFKPAGGRRHPAAGVLAAFAVSGLGHEYIFSVAVGRIQGYQTVFFLLSGLAVVATARMRPRGALAVVGVLATLAFVLVSSAFFFMSFDGLVRFYSEAPAWLTGW